MSDPVFCWGSWGLAFRVFASAASRLGFRFLCFLYNVVAPGGCSNKDSRPRSNLGIKRVLFFGFKGIIREPTLSKKEIGA